MIFNRVHRDFLIVAMVLNTPEPFPDNWIYVHSGDVRVGRIQNFQQRGTGISSKITTEFVDFVQHDQRIVCPGSTNRLNHASRHGSNISPSMFATAIQ